jgi:hypothetical protein
MNCLYQIEKKFKRLPAVCNFVSPFIHSGKRLEASTMFGEDLSDVTYS